MAMVAIQGLQNPLPDFAFPSISPSVITLTWLDPTYPQTELPSFALPTSTPPNPLSMRPIHPLPPPPIGAGGQFAFPI